MKSGTRVPLTHLQARFVSEYLAAPNNAAAAARRAGYSEKGVRVRVSTLLKHPVISNIIKKERDKAEHKLVINKENALRRMYAITQTTIDEVLDEVDGNYRPKDFKSMSSAARASIAEIKCSTDRNGVNTTSVKMYSPIEAFSSLAKTLGWNMDKEKPQFPARDINLFNQTIQLGNVPRNKLLELKRLAQTCADEIGAGNGDSGDRQGTVEDVVSGILGEDNRAQASETPPADD